jgi:hypothetical protein
MFLFLLTALNDDKDTGELIIEGKSKKAKVKSYK